VREGQKGLPTVTDRFVAFAAGALALTILILTVEVRGQVPLHVRPLPADSTLRLPPPRKCKTLAYRPDLDAYECQDGARERMPQQ